MQDVIRQAWRHTFSVWYPAAFCSTLAVTEPLDDVNLYSVEVAIPNSAIHVLLAINLATEQSQKCDNVVGAPVTPLCVRPSIILLEAAMRGTHVAAGCPEHIAELSLSLLPLLGGTDCQMQWSPRPSHQQGALCPLHSKGRIEMLTWINH
ncbi:hypothetical protein GDO78_015986 [Eleutherodactylus coqui]|uniref:Uncharacterized protein n=1 Tax=Eleutherodactylus coqui TaxID=57060 RepID=A0A8J6ELK0_ELECQ|nr:hypothetical protein GDO78_015986 [Eleutherodactylus coqui]